MEQGAYYCRLVLLRPLLYRTIFRDLILVVYNNRLDLFTFSVSTVTKDSWKLQADSNTTTDLQNIEIFPYFAHCITSQSTHAIMVLREKESPSPATVGPRRTSPAYWGGADRAPAGLEGNLEGGADKNRGVDCGRTGSYVAVPPVSVSVLSVSWWNAEWMVCYSRKSLKI